MGLSYQRKLEKMRRTGLCMQCNVRPIKERQTLCVECSLMVTRISKARYADRVAKNLCTDCAKPLNGRMRKGRLLRTCADCRTKLNKGGSGYHPNTPEYRRKRQREWWDAVFEHYGDQCACCGEADRTFLTLDHINNDGAKQRRELGRGLGFRGWLVKQGFPSGFQILCWNCNCAKWRVGICPHEAERRRARFVVA
jgi:hypothetical protein